jgi:hypothetical protein
LNISLSFLVIDSKRRRIQGPFPGNIKGEVDRPTEGLPGLFYIAVKELDQIEVAEAR